MSPGAVRALNTPMTEGYNDSAVWVAKGVNLIGALVPDMVAGGVARKVGDVTLRKMLTAGLEKKYIAAGMQPERATALAAEAVDKKMPDLFQAGLITHSTVSAQGQSAMAAADAVLNADYSELAQSPKFQQTFLSIDADPQHAQLTDRQKMDLAKERVADEVRAQLATDPELLAVNAMAAKLGDAQLFNLVTRGTAKTVKSGIVRNATEQGAINAAQGGYSRYQENTALRETAGMGVSPWEGVADATIEGAAFGAAMGAPFGAVAGYRGRRQAAEETAMRDAETVQQDDAAPQPESVDPVAQQRESMQGMNREQLLEQYADADMATEGDASAAHRREAASQLLNELDEQTKRQAVMNELKAKPRSELLEEYRRLSQKEGRTETEEQQFQAIREVIRPQQEVTPEAQSQPENAEDGNGSIYPTVRFRDPNEVRIEINGNGASRPAERIEKVRPDNRYFTDEKSAMGSDVFRNAAATGLKPSVVKKGENQYAVEMDNPAFSEDVATETINTLADGERIADADPMEQPAFMRDPRFRGFTGDDTEVQARLARGNAPTAEELVRSQMAEGDAGPTAQELTERPRLPAPGDIHPGQGYPLPGEVRVRRMKIRPDVVVVLPQPVRLRARVSRKDKLRHRKTPLVARGKHSRVTWFVVVCRHRMRRTRQHRYVKGYRLLTLRVMFVCLSLNHFPALYGTHCLSLHSRQKYADRPEEIVTSRSLRQSHLNLKQLSLLTGKLPCAEVKSGAKKLKTLVKKLRARQNTVMHSLLKHWVKRWKTGIMPRSR